MPHCGGTAWRRAGGMRNVMRFSGIVRGVADMQRGQAAVEILMSVALIVLIFMLVSWFVSTRQDDMNFVKAQYDSQRACSRLSFIISSVYSAKTNTEVKTAIETDANIVGNRIHIGNYSCQFLGGAENANLNAGRIKVVNNGGTVILENA